MAKMNPVFTVLKSSFSSTILLVICLTILVFRLGNVSEKETSWDVLGYYLPLPATFIYDDPLMENRQWIEKVNEEKQLTDTLYQISSTPDGKPMFFFLLGMAMLFLPFFLLGHGSAFLLGYPMDGFSEPYQYALVLGGLFYTFLGLFYLRKTLLHFFTEKTSAIVLVIIVLGTNYSHHLTLKNLETVNVLFFFVAVLIWNTIQWHNTQKIINLLMIGASVTFMSLVKPSEILILFLPLFYGVYNKESFARKWRLLLQYKVQFIGMFALCLLIALPQMSYWFVRTGSLFYDSYINPGVGLDVTSPYIFESLFSFKKGWFIYTPVMILSLIGFYFFFKKKKEVALSFFLYFIFTAYIIFSWTEWWYGAAFSNRPLITVYPILAVSLGFLVQFVSKQKNILKGIVSVFVLMSVFLNQFQWWQLRAGILEPYRMTKEYYFATFLKTTATNSDRELLSVFRNFDGSHDFNNREEYKLVSEQLVQNFPFELDSEIEFSPSFETAYGELTNEDHIWIEVEVQFQEYPEIDSLKMPLLITHINRKEGAYGYFSSQIRKEISMGEKESKFTATYMTPNIRNSRDGVKIYIWNKYKTELEVNSIKVKIFEKV